MSAPHVAPTMHDTPPATVVDTAVEVVVDIFRLIRGELQHGHVLLHLADALDPRGKQGKTDATEQATVWRTVARGLRHVAAAVGEDETTVGKALRLTARALAPMVLVAPPAAVASIVLAPSAAVVAGVVGAALLVAASIVARMWVGRTFNGAPVRVLVATCLRPFLTLFGWFSSDNVVVRLLRWYRDELVRLLSLSRRRLSEDTWPTLVTALRTHFAALRKAIHNAQDRTVDNGLNVPLLEALHLFRTFQRTAFMERVPLDAEYPWMMAAPFFETWMVHVWGMKQAGHVSFQVQTALHVRACRWRRCKDVAALRQWAQELLVAVHRYVAQRSGTQIRHRAGRYIEQRAGRVSHDPRDAADRELVALAHTVSMGVVASRHTSPSGRRKKQAEIHRNVIEPWKAARGRQDLGTVAKEDAHGTMRGMDEWEIVFHLFGILLAEMRR